MLFSALRCLAHLSLFVSLSTAASISRRATTCNGHAELCNRSYGNITFVGAHDSYAVGTNNLAVNQDHDVTQQLNDGIRLLQMQAHNQTGAIQLCHTSCFLFNGGTLSDYLMKVKTWMDSNPNDVVTLLIVNSDGFHPSDFAAVFSSTGLSSMSYSPPTATLGNTDWPTLSTMIDAGTRLVTFLDAGANFDEVPYLIDEFTNNWETAFDVTDTTFDCNVNRTKGDTQSQLYLINHFLDVITLGQPAPDVIHANTTNTVSGVGALGTQVDLCASMYGRNPNFLLVDFYEFGNGSVFEVGATANGVTYTPSTPIAQPVSTASGSSTRASATGNSSPSSFAFGHLMVSAPLVITSILLGGLAIV